MNPSRSLLPLFILGGLSAQATVYTDPLGDTLTASGHYMDIASVEVTNDASTLFINVNVGDNLGFAADSFARLMIGFDTGAGGSSAANAWSDQITMPGMDFFGGGSGAGINFYSNALGGWPEWQNAGIGSTWVEFWNPTIDANGIQFGVSLATLGLGVGETVLFDVYTAWDNPGHAIDAAGLNNGTSTQSSWTTLPYDSGSNVLSYTVVPEPSTYALLLGCFAGVLMLMRRRK